MSDYTRDTRSRHERGYGNDWLRLRKIAMERDLWLCQPCLDAGIATPAREVDHITPKAKGGTDDPDNLQAICIPCHAAKTAREGAKAQGKRTKHSLQIGKDGWPV